MSYRIQIKVGAIKVGKPLVWDVYDSKGVLLLHKGYVIETDKQLDILLARGIFHISDTMPEPDTGKPIHREESSPFQLIDQIYPRLEKWICSSVPETEKEFPSKIIGLCSSLQRACAQDAEATLSTIVLGPAGRYSIKHSVDVAIVCELIGQALKMSVDERLSMIAAAMTENIAMTELSDILYSQAAPLSDEQREFVHAHPASGVERLKALGVNDPLWLSAVLSHHQSSDGRGYPNGVKGESIPVSARLIAISDLFCAKVSGRSYRQPLSSHQAMQFVFSAGEGQIDADIAELFVKTLGIYLPGTFVCLTNSQIAVVTRRGEKIQFPIVYAVTGRDGMPLPGPVYRDTSHPDCGIARVIPASEVTVKVNRYQLWGYSDFNPRR